MALKHFRPRGVLRIFARDLECVRNDWLRRRMGRDETGKGRCQEATEEDSALSQRRKRDCFRAVSNDAGNLSKPWTAAATASSLDGNDEGPACFGNSTASLRFQNRARRSSHLCRQANWDARRCPRTGIRGPIVRNRRPRIHRTSHRQSRPNTRLLSSGRTRRRPLIRDPRGQSGTQTAPSEAGQISQSSGGRSRRAVWPPPHPNRSQPGQPRFEGRAPESHSSFRTSPVSFPMRSRSGNQIAALQTQPPGACRSFASVSRSPKAGRCPI